MSAPDFEKQRALFEEWYGDNTVTLALATSCTGAWIAWQAALAAQARVHELLEKIEQLPTEAQVPVADPAIYQSMFDRMATQMGWMPLGAHWSEQVLDNMRKNEILKQELIVKGWWLPDQPIDAIDAARKEKP